MGIADAFQKLRKEMIMFQKLVFAISFLLFAHSVSYACSCLPAPTVGSEFASSDVVMIVRADSFTSNGNPQVDGVNMIVEKVYKGHNSRASNYFFSRGRRRLWLPF